MKNVFAQGTAVAILCLISAGPAHAGEPRTHDGFMLRLSLGAGSAGTKIEDPTASIDLSGVASELNFAIGGMVQPNLAIHATLFGWSVADPDAEVDIPGVVTASGTLSGTATMGAFGAGVTYYLMPANVYLSSSLGFGSFSLDGDVTGETDSGLALDLTVGKEWWAGDSWGLGLAGGFTYHSLPDPDVSESWSGTSYALRFSATFN